MPDSPVTVFLFTDIEGSTRLWEQFPQGMRAALERHDEIAAQSVTSHRGRVVKTTGDGVHAVFQDPLDAVRAAVAMQIALADADFGPDIAIRVRAGLHAGIESERDNDFYGTAVNRAARIMSVAHGGQVIVSQAVASLLRDRLAEGLTLRSLGRVRLRDLRDPEEVFQVGHPRLRAEFPALRSLEGTPNNLPHGLTSFIGREHELADVRERIRATRMLTIFGIGGLGKSRLSLQVAASALDDYPDGVWFVELAPVADPRLVAQTLAAVLGLRDDAGASPQDAIRKFVRDRRLLIVLDNCEHLTQACAELARDILQAGPGVTILATSRERLGIAGEQTYPLAPFEVPPREPLAPDALSSFASVRLLSDRALAARPDFAVTAENASAVASICQQLDGIPLALELAAARVRSMSVQRIAERLVDRFKLLSTGDRTALPRQQTLRALIDWSYDLLSPEEQALFRRLSVFAGGFTLEAAEAVTQGGAIAGDDVQDLLGQLVEKSLVILDAAHDRYRMLETVRQYASERHADETSDGDDIRTRHLQFFLALCEKAAPELNGASAGAWLARLDGERENILAAHRWCDKAPDGGSLGLRLMRATRSYFYSRGQVALVYTATLEALARGGAAVRNLARCRALSDAGQFALRMGRNREALEHLLESLEIARELGDSDRVAIVLQPIGLTYLSLGETGTARRYLAEALDLARSGGDKREVMAATSAMQQLHRATGALDDAERMGADVLAIAREIEDRRSIGIALLNATMIAVQRRNTREALAMLREAAAIDREMGGTTLRQSLLEAASGVAALRGEAEPAARFFGAAEAEAGRLGLRRDPADQAFMDAVHEALVEAAGKDALERALAATRQSSSGEAIADLRAWLVEVA
ncbi:MAG: adenylate/guanylate cyclase domain-containing protein [Burkholderiales bacterium]